MPARMCASQVALLDLEAEFPRTILPAAPPAPAPVAASGLQPPAQAAHHSSSSGGGGGSSSQEPPPPLPTLAVWAIQRGATDLKKALAEARRAGRLLVVVWVQGQQREAKQDVLLHALAQAVAGVGPDSGAGVLLATADVGVSAANAGLAGALKVAPPFPCVHVYQVCAHLHTHRPWRVGFLLWRVTRHKGLQVARMNHTIAMASL